jgi:hypothetical protein
MTWLYNTPTKIILIISFLLTSCEKEDLILSKIDSKINPTTNEKIKSSNIKRSRNRKSRKRKTIIR